jgi:hypothetical protein
MEKAKQAEQAEEMDAALRLGEDASPTSGRRFTRA